MIELIDGVIFFNDMKCNRRKLVEIERIISISIVRISLLKNLIDIFII